MQQGSKFREWSFPIWTKRTHQGRYTLNSRSPQHVQGLFPPSFTWGAGKVGESWPAFFWVWVMPSRIQPSPLQHPSPLHTDKPSRISPSPTQRPQGCGLALKPMHTPDGLSPTRPPPLLTALAWLRDFPQSWGKFLFLLASLSLPSFFPFWALHKTKSILFRQLFFILKLHSSYFSLEQPYWGISHTI